MPLADAACAPTRRPTRHEKTATEKLKQSFGKLGCPYDVDSIHVPQHGWGTPCCRAVACRRILTVYDLKLADFWQTTLPIHQPMQRKRDFLIF
jgi:hypothetical protein